MKPDRSNSEHGVRSENRKQDAKRSKLEPERDMWAIPDSLVKPLYKTISATEAADESKPAGKRTGFRNRVNQQKEKKALNQAKRNRFK